MELELERTVVGGNRKHKITNTQSVRMKIAQIAPLSRACRLVLRRHGGIVSYLTDALVTQATMSPVCQWESLTSASRSLLPQALRLKSNWARFHPYYMSCLTSSARWLAV